MSRPAHAHRLGDLAERFGLKLLGDRDTTIRGVATLAGAGTGDLGFLANSRYRAQLATTQASAVIVASADVAGIETGRTVLLVAEQPYVSFARIAALFADDAAGSPGIHPSAVICADADIAEGVSIGPFCVIESGSRVEAGAVLGPHCTIGADCVVGAQSRLGANVTLVRRVRLG